MKKLIVVFITFLLTNITLAQNDKLTDPEPYFSALIVENIESSKNWYTNILGFEIINNKEYLDAGFKQANLKRGGILIELIELKTSVTPSNVIPNYNNKTRIKGLFKIGFLVSDFDKWIDHLTELDVNFHGNVVKDQISGKKMIIIKDPDGNRIQLFEK